MSELTSLKERAKELRCLYEVNAAVSERGEAPPTVFLRVLSVVPAGWQRPESTGAHIEYLGRSYVGPGYTSLGQKLRAPLRLWNVEVGYIEVSDVTARDGEADVFLPEEHELLRTIAMRLGEYLEWKHTQLLGERLPAAGEHWRWRQKYVEAMVAALDHARFGVARVHLGGSTETGEAGPGSDIDLFVEFTGSEAQRHDLELWLEGWSGCLAELAFQQTGHRPATGMLDVHYLAPAEVARQEGPLRALRPPAT